MLLCLPVDVLARYRCQRVGTRRKLKSRPFAIYFVQLSKIAGGHLDLTRALPARPESLPGARASSWTPPSADLPQAASGPFDRLNTGDAVADVKKNWVARRPICHARCSRFS